MKLAERDSGAVLPPAAIAALSSLANVCLWEQLTLSYDSYVRLYPIVNMDIAEIMLLVLRAQSDSNTFAILEAVVKQTVNIKSFPHLR